MYFDGASTPLSFPNQKEDGSFRPLDLATNSGAKQIGKMGRGKTHYNIHKTKENSEKNSNKLRGVENIK